MNVICSHPVSLARQLSFEPGTQTKESRHPMESQFKPVEKEEKIMLPLNEPITKYSARLIRKQLLSGGRKLNRADRRYLKHMVDYGKLLDAEAFHILLNLLLSGPQD